MNRVVALNVYEAMGMPKRVETKTDLLSRKSFRKTAVSDRVNLKRFGLSKRWL
jgi:hypothetical protein